MDAVLSASLNPATQKAAEARMAEWQTADPPGFAQGLAQAVLHPTSPATQKAAAVLFPRFVADKWSAAVRTGGVAPLGPVRDALLQGLVQGTAALPADVLPFVCRGLGAVLAAEFPRVNPGAMDGLFQWWGGAPTSPAALLLVHFTLKEAERRRVRDKRWEAEFARFGPAAVQVLQSLYDATAAAATDAAAFKVAAKIVLRCAAYAAFDAAIVASCATVAAAAAAMAAHGPLGPERLVVVERAGKVVTGAVKRHLRSVTGATLATVFFPFALAMAQHGGSGALGEKATSRALDVLALVLTSGESGANLQAGIQQYFTADTTAALLEALMPLLADRDGDEEWVADPERYVISADMDDSPDDPHHKAADVFVHLLSAGGALVVERAWALVSRLLESGDVAAVTAALHAMGLGCYEMGEGQEEQFAQFFSARLDGIIRGTTPATPVVVRRAAWVAGQWCGAAPHPNVRRGVHGALAQLLQASKDPVLQFTAMRAVQHYLNDTEFQPSEVVATAHTVCTAVAGLMPRLRDPDMVREVAALLVSMLERTEGQAVTGAAIVQLLAPVFAQLIDACGGGDTSVVSALGVVADKLSVTVAFTDAPQQAWDLLGARALQCTVPESPMCAEDGSWDLLAALMRAADPTTAAAAVPLVLQAALPQLRDADTAAVANCCRATAAAVIALHGVPAGPEVQAALTATADAAASLLARSDLYDHVWGAAAVVDLVALLHPPAATATFPVLLQRASTLDPESVTFAAVAAALMRVASIDMAAAWGPCPGQLPGFVEALAVAVDCVNMAYPRRVVACSSARMLATHGAALTAEQRQLLQNIVTSEQHSVWDGSVGEELRIYAGEVVSDPVNAVQVQRAESLASTDALQNTPLH